MTGNHLQYFGAAHVEIDSFLIEDPLEHHAIDGGLHNGSGRAHRNLTQFPALTARVEDMREVVARGLVGFGVEATVAPRASAPAPKIHERDIVIPMGLHALEVGFDISAQLTERALVAADALFDELSRLAEQRAQNLIDERFLAREVVRDDAFAGPCFAVNLGQRSLGEALASNGLDSCFHDLPTAGFFNEGGFFSADRFRI